MLLHASLVYRKLAVCASAQTVPTLHESQSTAANILQIFPQSTKTPLKTTATLTPASMLAKTPPMVLHLPAELRPSLA